MREFKQRCKRNFRFSAQELGTMVIVALTFGFVLSFREWGETSFDLHFGLFNLFNAALIVLFSIIVHESVHKLYAIKRGYTAELKNWNLGILISLFVAFLTNGYMPFLAFGGVIIHRQILQRIGKFQYEVNLTEHAYISAAGPFSNLLLAVGFKMLALQGINSPLMQKAMVINLLLCLTNMLPFPPLDGLDVFYASRLRYAGIMGFFVCVSVLLYFTNYIISTFIIALLGAAVTGLIFGVLDKQLFQA